VGPRAVLDAVVKRKIPSPRQEDTSISGKITSADNLIYLFHAILLVSCYFNLD
jgi:hypothetical protein